MTRRSLFGSVLLPFAPVLDLPVWAVRMKETGWWLTACRKHQKCFTFWDRKWNKLGPKLMTRRVAEEVIAEVPWPCELVFWP